MKRKNRIACLLVCCLCLSLCACGSSEPKTTEANGTVPSKTEAAQTQATEAAQTQTLSCGDWTVDVPAGFEFKTGDFLDENDTRYFSVKKSSFSYFEFSADGEERVMNKYNYNKNTYTNEQKDVKGTFGGHEWIGFQYSDGYGGYGVEAYTTIDGQTIRVASVGYAFDNEILAAVLGSLKYTPSATPATPETDAPATEAPATEAPETETEYEPTEGAPVYAHVLQFKDVMLGIKEGYTELKDALPTMYVMTNDETGGKVYVQNQPGTAAEQIPSIMSGLEYELREEKLNGMTWTVATSDSLWCFGTDTGSDALVFTIDFGATEEEMQDLMFGVMANEQQ